MNVAPPKGPAQKLENDEFLRTDAIVIKSDMCSFGQLTFRVRLSPHGVEDRRRTVTGIFT